MIREDDNGFWEIEDNPISCAGVYPYLGAHLPGAPDPTKIYMVLRPPEELGKPETITSFKLQPWTIGHEMLGPEDAGLTPPEEKGIHGVIGEKVYFDEKADPPTLFANIKGFSEKLKEAIKSGIKQLSAGYFHDVEWKSGVWNGTPYDAVQRNISGNHLASVPSGRMGAGVAVMDSLRGFDPNPFTLKQCTMEEGLMTLEQLFEMLKGIAERLKALEDANGTAAGTDAEGADPDKKEEENKAAGTDAEGADPDKKEEENKAAGTDDEGADPEGLSLETLAEGIKAIADRLERLEGGNAAGTDAEGADPAKKEESGKPSGASMDAAVLQKKILRDLAGRDALARELLPRVGTFDYSLMTEKELAAYGCKKLGIPHAKGHESTAIRAYLKGADAGASSGRVFSMDSASASSGNGGTSNKMKNYLEGK